MNTEIFALVLFELLTKSALILTAAAIVNRVWLRASAAQRHLVWCAALCTLLLLPFSRVFEPRWAVPLQRVTVELPPPTQPMTGPIVSLPIVEPKIVTVIAAPRWRAPDWKVIVLWSWATGAGLLLVARLLGSVRLLRLRSKTLTLDDERTHRLATEIFRELGIRRRVELRLLPTGCVPLTWGSLRPVLTLPAEALGWEDGPLEAALRHEAGHIARYDHLTRWLAQVACILYWPNPLVWIAARHFRAAQEEATDDLVLRGGTAPDEYAAQLFEVARTLATRHHLSRHAIAMASLSTLERRMLAIVDEGRARSPLNRRAVFGSVLAVTLTLGVSTGVQVQGQDGKAAEEKSAALLEVRQIEIEAKFVELSEEAAAKLPFFREDGVPDAVKGTVALSGVFAEAQYREIDQTLSETQGVKVIARPRVTTKSGQRAEIEISRDVRFATGYEKDGAGWKPKEFGTKKAGIVVAVNPVIGSDGETIELELAASLVDLVGWTDLDSDAKYPGEVPAGRRALPMLASRKVTTSVSFFNGQTVVLSTVGKPKPDKDFPDKVLPRRLAIFVSAKLLGKQLQEAAGAITASPVPTATSDPADEIVIPKIEFRGATMSEAVEFLIAKGRVAGKGPINIIVPKLPMPEPVVSLSLTNVPFPEAVRYVASLGSLKVRREANAFILENSSAAPAPANPETAKPSPPPSGALAKAQSIVIPRISFKEATLTEALDFLRQRSVDLDSETDPAKRGVLITLLDPPVTARDARITIDLTSIPLNEALRYLASLAGLELAAEPNTLVLRAPRKSPRSAEAPVDLKADRSTSQNTTITPPEAVWVPGKPGFVVSPHTPDRGYIDVRGFPPGTQIKDPFTGKSFIVPEPLPVAAAATPEKTLGLLGITAKDLAETSAAKHLTLQIPIKVQAGKTVDPREVVTQVLFYDSVAEKDVVPTVANVTSRWTNSSADWRNSGTETLEVDYLLPRSDGQDAGLAGRKYYGYLVRVYYQGALQAATAEPKGLATQFPPPLTLK